MNTETFIDQRRENGVITIEQASLSGYKPTLAMVSYHPPLKIGEPIIMGFYSHQLAEGDIMENRWIRHANPYVNYIKVEKILERRDAKGDWEDNFNKDLYVKAIVSFM